MNKPSVGRIVHYVLSESESSPELKNNNATVLPAVIVRVWSETCVNLKVSVDGHQVDVWKTSVLFSEEPKPGFWSWPPRV